MERQKLKKILQEYYKKDMIKSIMCGRSRPSMDRAVTLKKDHGISIEFWFDVPNSIVKSKRQNVLKERNNEDS